MTPSLPIRTVLALATACILVALATPRLLAEESPEKQSRQAEKRAQAEAQRTAKAEAEEAKRDKKLSKEERKQQGSRDAKRRAAIESGARTAVAWFAEALALYQRGRYLDARGILLPLEDSARAVDIQEKVKLLIADTYFEQGGALNLAEALARYKSYLTFFPSSENSAYAQYQLGRSYFKQLGHPDRDQSFTDQAIFEYTKLIDNYPESEYVAAAKKDVLEARARRAQHEFEVAQFYWDWNDKGAAAKRLQEVLKERPELPAREKALWMCAQALYDTGQHEQGDSYAERLAQDYPGSSYISRLNRSSQGAVAQQVSRGRKDEKEKARTARSQSKQDRRRTRIVRKDSGLPGDVPQTWDLSGSTQPAAAGAPGASSGPGSPAAAQKQQERSAAQQAEAAKREAEEQERAQKDAQREAAREAERSKEAEKRAEKEAQRQAALAAETPEQKAKREKAEAKAKEEVDRLEAEEQRRAEKQAVVDAKRRAKQDAEDAKKARKKK